MECGVCREHTSSPLRVCREVAPPEILGLELLQIGPSQEPVKGWKGLGLAWEVVELGLQAMGCGTQGGLFPLVSAATTKIPEEII